MIPDIKFEDIDPSFLDFKPSTKLPFEVLEKFYFNFNRQKIKYVSYRTREKYLHIQFDLFDVYLGAKFLPIFSYDCEDVWQSLYSIDNEATIRFSRYICGMGNWLSFNKSGAENFYLKVEYIASLKEKSKEFLSYLAMYGSQLTDDGGWDFYEEESRNRVIPDIMHYSLKESIEEYIERLEFVETNLTTESEIAKIKEAYPISRKRNIENAEAVFFIKILNHKFLFFFGKPYHDHVATFINTVFGTSYDYSAIAQIVRKR